MERPMQKLNDLSRSPSPLDPDGTLIAVIELSLLSWLVAGIVPGVEIGIAGVPVQLVIASLGALSAAGVLKLAGSAITRQVSFVPGAAMPVLDHGSPHQTAQSICW